MSDQHDWQQFFDWHAPDYMNNAFTWATEAEVAFLIEQLGLEPGQKVLDVGCGTGRHSVPLAAHGCVVTGVDISAGMLAQARQAAEAAGVEVEWVQADATRYMPRPGYDAALCLCEGAFTLLSTGDDPLEHDLAILRNVYAALRPGGRFLLTALNGLRHARAASPEAVAAGHFDPLTMTEHSEIAIETPDGPRTVAVRERGYTPTELQLMFRMAGFAVEHVGGGTAGDWGLRPLDLDEYEIMVIGQRPAA